MENNLGVNPIYSDMMYTVFSDIRESIAVKRFKETTEILVSLGYSKEEIKNILKGVLNRCK